MSTAFEDSTSGDMRLDSLRAGIVRMIYFVSLAFAFPKPDDSQGKREDSHSPERSKT